MGRERRVEVRVWVYEDHSRFVSVMVFTHYNLLRKLWLSGQVMPLMIVRALRQAIEGPSERGRPRRSTPERLCERST